MQQAIRRAAGFSVQKADELCDNLMKAGQCFNIAVKGAVEDWADQKLQGNELKKTISNWDHNTGRRDPERDDELQAAHSNSFELRCQLHSYKERFENIQFEAQCIISEFEKLRGLSEKDESFLNGLVALFKVCRPLSALLWRNVLSSPSTSSVSILYVMSLVANDIPARN